MRKRPPVEELLIDEFTRDKSSKHKRRETRCADKRRNSDRCGICGSEDLCFEQLVFCLLCGAEVFNIGVKVGWQILKEEYPCSCKGDFLHANRGMKFYKNVHGDYTNRVCLSCNSIETNNCPVCGKSNKISYYNGKCWTSISGEKVCRYCGYRHPGYGKDI